MEIHQARYFLATCEELNFTRAAKKSGVSQPSLTRAIQMLEKELGGELFRRRRSRIELTELGKLVRPYLEEMVAKSALAKKLAAEFARKDENELRLAFTRSVSPAVIIKLMEMLNSYGASGRVILRESEDGRIEDEVLWGQIDAAIHTKTNHLPEQKLDHVPVASDKMVIALSKQHRLAAKGTLDVGDLRDEAFLGKASHEFVELMRPQTTSQSLAPAADAELRSFCESDCEEFLQAMIARGFGFGFLPRSAITNPGVAAVPLTGPEHFRYVLLTTRKYRPALPLLDALINQLKTEPALRWSGAGGEPAVPSIDLLHDVGSK